MENVKLRKIKDILLFSDIKVEIEKCVWRLKARNNGYPDS